MESIINCINRLNNINEEISSLEEIVRSAPEGRLIAREIKARNCNSQQYKYTLRFQDTDNIFHEKYFKKSENKTAARIAEKMYAEKKIIDLKEEKKYLETIISHRQYLPKAKVFLQQHTGISALLPKSLKDLDNSEYVKEWLKTPYKKNTKYPEQLKYPTIIPGLTVRSKAEADIVSILDSYKIPFFYDVEITLNGITVSMDFICLNVFSKNVWYWDHRGMMDNPTYVKKIIYCDQLFLQNGIIPWINMLVTTETSKSPLDIQWVKTIVEYFLV